MSWEVVIGLEIHCQLATQSKLFSGAPTAFGAEANRQACAVDLALPGVLPVLNKEAVRMAVKFGLAIGAEIGQTSVFARKNYFYPDLPKGYQISQFEQPIVGKGQVSIELEDGSEKLIGVTRAHMEEDAGKSLHEDFHGQTGIDLNRAGTPLIEIVSEPDLRSAQEAVAYAKKIHSIVRYLDISDGNMQEGSFRCDANVSIRKPGEDFGTRREIKNLNSFRFLERAIELEVENQIEIIEAGGKVHQATVLYDDVKDETRVMRSKEDSNDYRYFPDPDLLPVEVANSLIEEIRQELPELPEAKKKRFMQQYELNTDDAVLLTGNKALAAYFEKVAEACGSGKLASNWISGELLAALNRNEMELEQSPISADQLAGLLKRIHDKTIPGKIGKQVFKALWEGEGQTADEIIDKKGLKPIDSGAVEAIVDKIIADNPQQLEQYRSGKDKLFGFFVGQVMKASQGKADPATVNKLLKEKL